MFSAWPDSAKPMPIEKSRELRSFFIVVGSPSSSNYRLSMIMMEVSGRRDAGVRYGPDPVGMWGAEARRIIFDEQVRVSWVRRVSWGQRREGSGGLLGVGAGGGVGWAILRTSTWGDHIGPPK